MPKPPFAASTSLPLPVALPWDPVFTAHLSVHLKHHIGKYWPWLSIVIFKVCLGGAGGLEVSRPWLSKCLFKLRGELWCEMNCKKMIFLDIFALCVNMLLELCFMDPVSVLYYNTSNYADLLVSYHVLSLHMVWIFKLFLFHSDVLCRIISQSLSQSDRKSVV